MDDNDRRELGAWRERFPMYAYRPQDDMVALRGETVKYGCHCDLEPGMEPDGCVLDYNAPQDCVYAGGISRREECKYWQPIKFKGAA